MTIKIAGIQMLPQFMNIEANLDQMIRSMETTAKAGARLVIFPECALCGYCFESLEEAIPYAESIPGPSTLKLVKVCQKLQLHVVYGLLERAGDQLFNAAVLLGPEGLIGKYRKVHLPSLGVDKFVQPGDLGFGVYETPLGRIGLNICYDGAFPEGTRVMALKGADLVVLPTNWPTGAEEFAEHLINARGLENHIFFAAVNRVGIERGFRFIGRSRISDVHGRTLALASAEQEEILYAEIDPLKAREKRIVRVPGKHEIHRFNDRRPELYGEIIQPKH
ncbi:MAG: carbon-nitrogen hydrolase family protein [Terriglobia bacterium]